MLGGSVRPVLRTTELADQPAPYQTSLLYDQLRHFILGVHGQDSGD